MPTPPSEDELAEYLGLGIDASVADLLDTAVEIIGDRLGTSGMSRVPQHTYSLAVRMLAAEIDLRRRAAGGIVQQQGDGQAVRLARDTWVSVAPLLDNYRPLGASG
jgi:hypothetical protein